MIRSFPYKKILITAAVGIVAAVMLIFTVLSALGLGNRSQVELTLNEEVPAVVESIDDGTIIATREGSVIRKTADDETVWTTKLTDISVGGSAVFANDLTKSIAVNGNEIICVTSGGRHVISLNLESGAYIGSSDINFEPVDIALNDGYLAVNTHQTNKNQLVVFKISGGRVDYSSKKTSNSSYTPALVNIAMTDDGIFGLGQDSIVRLFDPNSPDSSDDLFEISTEELMYITPSGENYSAATANGYFLTIDSAGKIVKKSNGGKYFEKVASHGNHIVAVTRTNDIAYFDGNKVYKVPANCTVSRLMLSSQSAFLIKSDDTISVYDFERIKANHTWKVVLPICASFLAASVLALVILVLLSVPATREKVADFFKRLGKALWKYKKVYLFLLIPFSLLGVFAFFPVIWGLVLAFTKYVPGLKTEFVGFDNFITAFKTASFLGSVGNMLIFLVVDIVMAIIPCFILAEMMFMFRSRKAGYLARVLTVIPGILPGVAAVYIWTSGIYGANGLINMVLQSFGLKQFNFNWLGNEATARNALLFYGFPFLGSYIMLFSALRGVPDSFYEAAKLDGCGTLRRIFKIDIPLLAAQFKYIFVTTFIASIQNFGRSFLTTGGEFGTMVPSLEIYYQINKYYDYGVAAAMSLVLFIVIFVATLINQKIKTESIY